MKSIDLAIDLIIGIVLIYNSYVSYMDGLDYALTGFSLALAILLIARMRAQENKILEARIENLKQRAQNE